MKEIEQSAVSASSSVITLFHIFQINTPASHSLVSYQLLYLSIISPDLQIHLVVQALFLL